MLKKILSSLATTVVALCALTSPVQTNAQLVFFKPITVPTQPTDPTTPTQPTVTYSNYLISLGYIFCDVGMNQLQEVPYSYNTDRATVDDQFARKNDCTIPSSLTLAPGQTYYKVIQKQHIKYIANGTIGVDIDSVKPTRTYFTFNILEAKSLVETWGQEYFNNFNPFYRGQYVGVNYTQTNCMPFTYKYYNYSYNSSSISCGIDVLDRNNTAGILSEVYIIKYVLPVQPTPPTNPDPGNQPTNPPQVEPTFGKLGEIDPNSRRETSPLTSDCETCFSLNIGVPAAAGKPMGRGGVSPNSGTKVETKTDIVFPFEFTRNFSSKRTSQGHLGVFGHNWKHNYEKRLMVYENFLNNDTMPYIATIFMKRENDEEMVFFRSNANAEFKPYFKDHVKYKLSIVSLMVHEFKLTTPNGNEEYYSMDGRLLRIKQRGGYTLTFSYSGNLLTNITDSYNRWISLEYSAYADIVTQITTSSGDTIDYNYDDGRLQTVNWNNSRMVTYGYNFRNLASVTNAKGEVIKAYTYDDANRVREAQEFTGNITNTINYSYQQNATVASQADGTAISYGKTTAGMRDMVSGISYSTAGSNTFMDQGVGFDQEGKINGISSSSGKGVSYVYDEDGWIISTIQNGNKSNELVWDKAKNLLLSKKEYLTSGERLTSYTYNVDGLPLTVTVSGSSGTRTTSYTWGTYGKLLTKTSPTGAVTTYTYYDDMDSNINKRGMVKTVSNSLNHTITFNDYDSRGNPTSMTDAANRTKIISYNDLGQPLSISFLGTNTVYTYDLDGFLKTASMPNGYGLSITYDRLGNKLSVSDNHGGSISYAYDNNGMPINESIYAGNVLHDTTNRVFDGVGRLKELWKANSGEKYSYGYDYGMNPTSETTPRGDTSTMIYDRGVLSSKTGQGDNYYSNLNNEQQPMGMMANGKEYNYGYNEFSEIVSYTSPNTGTDNYAYNIAGKSMTKQDASGTVTTTNFDSLGRATNISAGSEQKTFVYDTNQVGQLTSATNNSASLTYSYNNLGLVSQKTQTVGSNTKSLGYGYNAAGQLTSMTYPSGLVVNYNYNNGVITSVTASGSVSGTILSNIVTQPMTFTPLSWTWGNGLNRNKALDASGKVTGINDGLLTQSYSIDGVGNVLSMTDAGIQSLFEYNIGSNALTKYTKNGQSRNYGYTPTHDKDTITAPGEAYSYMYLSGTNKLQYFASQEDGTYNYSHDAKGNVTNNGNFSFVYNKFNRLTQAKKGNQTYNYAYNALDERVSKSGPGISKQFIYNESHQLTGEYNGSTMVVEYIYLGSIPVAVYKNNQLYYIHTDHLTTPRSVTSMAGQTVWKWDNVDPFGASLPQSNNFELNLRFMGQYFDNETKVYYNYYRYYDPNTGRYMQSDPIGLNGGFDTYAYVGNNPMGAVDPLGLKKIIFASLDDNKPSTKAMYEAYKNDYVPKNVLAIYAHGVDDKKSPAYASIELDTRSDFAKTFNYPLEILGGGNFAYIGDKNILVQILEKGNINLNDYDQIWFMGCLVARRWTPFDLAWRYNKTVLATEDYMFYGQRDGKIQTLGAVKYMPAFGRFNRLWVNEFDTLNDSKIQSVLTKYGPGINEYLGK